MAELRWRKSSRSGTQGTACVEVAAMTGATAVRDSKAPARACLEFPALRWDSFLSEVKDGRYDG